MESLNIIKFASLSFTTLEYFVHAEEELLAMIEASARSKYNWDAMNRQSRKRAEKSVQNHVKKASKNLKEWKQMLQKLADSFINDPKHEHVYDLSIDLLHRTLDSFSISGDEEVVQDEFKDYYFQSMDSIKSKKRSDEELLKLKSSLSNFLTVNKLT